MNIPNVYFIRLTGDQTPGEQKRLLENLFAKSGAENYFKAKDLVAIKTHFGEKNNKGYVSPAYIKVIIDQIKCRKGKPFLTETSTLYVGSRSNAVDHIALANEHGFGFKEMGAPIIMADGLIGDSEKNVKINGVHCKEVGISSEILKAHSVMVITHFKGHLASGFGGAIKNVGMGLANRKGKMRQHSDMKPRVKPQTCTACGVCINWCPTQAISMVEGKASINSDICIGCGECLAVCRFNAIEYNWKTTSKLLQEKMAEHALGVAVCLKSKIFYFNFINNITKDCDCMGGNCEIIASDVGVVASDDMVAIDQASLDLIVKSSGEDVFKKHWQNVDHDLQLAHGEKIGLGSRKYNLVEI